MDSQYLSLLTDKHTLKEERLYYVVGAIHILLGLIHHNYFKASMI